MALTLAKDDKQWIDGGGFNYVLETADLTTAEILPCLTCWQVVLRTCRATVTQVDAKAIALESGREA